MRRGVALFDKEDRQPRLARERIDCDGNLAELLRVRDAIHEPDDRHRELEAQGLVREGRREGMSRPSLARREGRRDVEHSRLDERRRRIDRRRDATARAPTVDDRQTGTVIVPGGGQEQAADEVPL